jgi:CheY-like chemotaxis protein
LRVLVVDDNATNRLVLTGQLAAWQVAADTAVDAADGWRLLVSATSSGRPYDVAVLDLCMPDVDGLELATRMSTDRGLTHIPTILLTSAGLHDQEAAIAAGVRASLSKPVRSSELHDALLRTTTTGRASSPRARPRPAPSAGPGRGHVLVVDDNEVNRIVAEGILVALGYAVDLADDGRQALSALADRTYAAVLMDCHMPGMDGFAATAELRRLEGTARRTPVIAMTAGVFAEDRERCTAAGMDDFAPKPIDAEALGRTLARWVGAADQPPVLDEDRLTVLRRIGAPDGWGVLPAVIEAFLRSAPDHGSALLTARGDGDVEVLRAVLHRLRGSAVNLGASRLAASCAALEALLGDAATPDPAVYERLPRELAQACDALERLLPPAA